MKYSQDLRKKVIEFIEQGKGIAETSRIFGISRPAIYKWLKMKKLDGDLLDRPRRGTWKKIDPELLIAFIKDHPDLSLAEYAKHFKASAVAICRAFKKLKITRKKRHIFIRKGMKPSVQHFWHMSSLSK
jgi:putative transposase